jgi:hypothetical protein
MAGPNMKNRRQALEEASYLVAMRTELQPNTSVVLGFAKVFEDWLNRDEEDDFTYFEATWGHYRVYPDGRVEYLDSGEQEWVPAATLHGWPQIGRKVSQGELKETSNPLRV